MKKRDQNMKNIHKKNYSDVAESTDEGCSGYKYPDKCPHDGNFDPYSSVCAECADNAMKATNEAFDDHVEAVVRDLRKDIS